MLAVLVVAITPARVAVAQARLNSSIDALKRGDTTHAISSALASNAASSSLSGPYEILAFSDVRAGRDDLAQKVQWVAETIGDGLGFDVLSFDEQGESEKLVEVKTTGLGKFHPFYVTVNEVRCSEDMTETFHLFRVFDFARKPRVYILTGSLRMNCRLEPTVYRATI